MNVKTAVLSIIIALFAVSCGMTPYKNEPDCRRKDFGVCGRASDIYELCGKDPQLCGGTKR